MKASGEVIDGEAPGMNPPLKEDVELVRGKESGKKKSFKIKQLLKSKRELAERQICKWIWIIMNT